MPYLSTVRAELVEAPSFNPQEEVKCFDKLSMNGLDQVVRSTPFTFDREHADG